MADPTEVPVVLVDAGLRNLAVTASVQLPISSSALIVAGAGADGVVRYLNIDSSSSLVVTGTLSVFGANSSGSTITANPVLIAGRDYVSGTVRLAVYDDVGAALVHEKEEDMFVVIRKSYALSGGSVNIISLWNTAISPVDLRIYEVFFQNAQTEPFDQPTFVEFQLAKLTAAVTFGISLTPAPYNSRFPFSAFVQSSRDGATPSTSSVYMNFKSTSVESRFNNPANNVFNIWSTFLGSRQPIVINPGEGINLSRSLTSITGVYDFFIRFSQVPHR